MRILVQMGMTLRRLNEKKEEVKLANLREKIVNKYKRKGLHIAQFVQENILREALGDIAKTARTSIDLVVKVEELLQQIDYQTQFVKQTDDMDVCLRRIQTKIDAHAPDTFIVFTQKSARPKGKKILTALVKSHSSTYEIEGREDSRRFLIIMTLKDNDLTD